MKLLALLALLMGAAYGQTIYIPPVGQAPLSIAIGSEGCTGTTCSVPNIDDTFASNVSSGLPPSGTYVGTLSTTLSAGTPPFSGGYSLVAHVGGDNCGTGTINNSPFQISSDQLKYNSGATAGTTYNVCVKATTGSNSTTQELAVTVHNVQNASAASTGCTGSGTSGSPWNYKCIQNAITAASTGDTVFLPGGNWVLNTTTDAAHVELDTAGVNLIGAGSGNTFDTWGHINNQATSSVVCPTAGTSITCIYQAGTAYTYGKCSDGAGTQFPFNCFGVLFIGALQNGSPDANCSNITISHIAFDGSKTTAGGNVVGLLPIVACQGPVTVNDIRFISGDSSQLGGLNTETQFAPYTTQNMNILNSAFTQPTIGGGCYSSAQGFQVLAGNGMGRNWTINNNVLYQTAYNAIYISFANFSGNQVYFHNDGTADECWPGGPGGAYAGYGMGGVGCTDGAPSGNSGLCIGSTNESLTNNLWYAPTHNFAIGSSVNDPSTTGGVNNLSVAGNWIIADHPAIDSCIWHLSNDEGNCAPGGGIGMTINTAVDFSCNESSNGSPPPPFSVTNNSLLGGSGANLDARGSQAGHGPSSATVTFTNGSAVINWANTLSVNDRVDFTSTGTLPTNFNNSTNYYVIATGLSSTHVEVSTTQGGSAVVAGSAGTGTQTGNALSDWTDCRPGNPWNGVTIDNIPNQVYGYNAQNNYLSSSSNQYLTNANTFSPTQTSNFCASAAGTVTGCATSGFTMPPTVSFSLGTLYVDPARGTSVPINSPTFTAQYGAVQWLASTSSTAPLSNDSRWSSNQSFWINHPTSAPPSTANSYIPPAYLSGVAHGNTVYLWVMDSNGNIGAATPQVIP